MSKNSSKQYEPDPFLDNISKFPTLTEKPNYLIKPQYEGERNIKKIPKMTNTKTKIGRRILSIYLVSTSLGFAAAWLGAMTFDHINMKIDSFRETMEWSSFR